MANLEAEYLDTKRFPLTTQGGELGALTFKQQKMVDAVNLDDLREAQQRGATLDEEQRQILESRRNRQPPAEPPSP